MDENYRTLIFLIFIGYALLLCLAAGIDVAKYIIPNGIVVAVAVLFVVAAFVVPIETDWFSHIGSAVLALTGGVVFYRFKVFGAGDIKLLTAVSLWVGIENLPLLLAYIALSGAGLALVLIQSRRLVMALAVHWPLLNAGDLPRSLVIGEKVPYGVAISTGSLLLAGKLPYFGFYF